MATKAKIDPAGRVVIPAALRKEMGLKAGDEVLIRLEDGEVRVISRDAALTRAQRRVAKYVRDDRSWTDEMIDERRRWAAEENVRG